MIKKIKRPPAPFPSLPIKVDSIIKHYFDRYREQGILPPIILGQIEGKLAVDMPKTLKFEMDNGITLWGRPDEYFELNDGNIVAFDHKTKSKEPEDVHSAYQLQLDVYSFLLKNLEYKTIDKGFLAYYYPDECELHNGMPFNCTIIEVKTNLSRVNKLIDKAYNILNGEMPEPNEKCEYCKWISESLKIR
jgi:CRISPR/Cas system-associated exonuclease Cas4 (RecB family)